MLRIHEMEGAVTSPAKFNASSTSQEKFLNAEAFPMTVKFFHDDFGGSLFPLESSLTIKLTGCEAEIQ